MSRTGSLALGQAHQDTTDYGLGFLRRDIENVIDGQLIRRRVRYNWGEEALEIAPHLSLGDWDATDLNGMASAFSQLIGSGVLSPQEPMIRERLGMPPDDAN